MTANLSRRWGRDLFLLVCVGGFLPLGCQTTPIDLSKGPAPLRTARPDGTFETYEDSLTGGEVFSMYCAQCHNARALAERPFANYENAVAHMRVRANLTGKEHEKLLEFFRRWHDVPSPVPPVDPSPKRLIYSQPLSELREQPATGAAAAPAQPQPAPGPAEMQPQPAPGAADAQPVPGTANARPPEVAFPR